MLRLYMHDSQDGLWYRRWIDGAAYFYNFFHGISSAREVLAYSDWWDAFAIVREGTILAHSKHAPLEQLRLGLPPKVEDR